MDSMKEFSSHLNKFKVCKGLSLKVYPNIQSVEFLSVLIGHSHTDPVHIFTDSDDF